VAEEGSERMGRKWRSQTGILNQSAVDALLSLWIKEDEGLRFMQIHKGLVEKGIVRNIEDKKATVRILTKATNQELVKHNEDSKLYFLNAVSQEFKLFNYLNGLRQKSEVTQLNYGSFLSKLCKLYFMGMPSSAFRHEDCSFLLEVLVDRVSRLFEALWVLATEIEIRKREAVDNQLHDYVLREVMLELLPYYLGSRAGPDLDGLSIDGLKTVMARIIEVLPNEVEPMVATLKERLAERLSEINKRIETIKLDEERIQYEKRFFEDKRPDFALIVIPPDYYLDENWSEKSSIKLFLDKCKEKSALYLASYLIQFKNQNVINVLDLYGQELLGVEKLIQTKSLYEKMYTSDYVATSIINLYGISSKKSKDKLLSEVRKLTEKFGRKSIIKYLAFSKSHRCFFLPTIEKEKLLQEIFPNYSEEEIHSWLNEGARLFTSLSEERIKDL
jgi:hypothetical protein